MRVTSKGQVTIPENVRRDAGFLPGTDVEFMVRDGEVILRRRAGQRSLREKQLREHLGRWRGSAGEGWTTAKVMSLTRDDE